MTVMSSEQFSHELDKLKETLAQLERRVMTICKAIVYVTRDGKELQIDWEKTEKRMEEQE